MQICGRAMRRSSLLSSRNTYLRIYFHPEETQEKDFILQTATSSTRDNPEWATLMLRMSDEFASDGSLCFSLCDDKADEAPDRELVIGTPVVRKSTFAPRRPDITRETSAANYKGRSRSIQGQFKSALRYAGVALSSRLSVSEHKQSSMMSHTGRSARVAHEDSNNPHRTRTGDLIDLAVRQKSKFGVIKEILDHDDGWTQREWDDFEGRIIGVDFRPACESAGNESDGNELSWFKPEELEVLFVGDHLDSILIECWEAGSDTLVGVCATTLGMLSSGRSDIFHLTNEDLLGTWPFTLETSQDLRTYSMGRSHTLLARSSTRCNNWVNAIEKAAHSAQNLDRYERATVLQSVGMTLLDSAKYLNESSLFIFFVYSAILTSFVSSIVTNELVPNPPYTRAHLCPNDICPPHMTLQEVDRKSHIEQNLQTLETIFTGIFTTDLFVNMVSNCGWKFLFDPFNWLDIIVVMISWVALIYDDPEADDSWQQGTAGMRVVRIVRLVRVFKLSRVSTDMRVILSAFSKSFSGIFFTLVLLFMFTCLGAIVTTAVLGKTQPERFGVFSLSWYTMWSIGLAPSKAYDIATEIMDINAIEYDEDPGNFTYIGLLMGFYSFLVFVLMNNVVLVVFIRDFLQSTTEDQKQRAQAADQQRLRLSDQNATVLLKPLLKVMVNFREEKELNLMIDDLYHHFQPNSEEEIGFSELQVCVWRERVRENGVESGNLPRGAAGVHM